MNKLGVLTAAVFAHAHQAVVRPGRPVKNFSDINTLKYFKENANEYHDIASGSLLGIKLAGQKSFPVGQVNILNHYPISFFMRFPCFRLF